MISLYADETPPWLSIHKWWLTEYHDICKTPLHAKTMILKAPDGEILEFESRKDAAYFFKTPIECLRSKVFKSHQTGTMRIRFNEVEYKLLEEEDEYETNT